MSPADALDKADNSPQGDEQQNKIAQERPNHRNNSQVVCVLRDTFAVERAELPRAIRVARHRWSQEPRFCRTVRVGVARSNRFAASIISLEERKPVP